MIERISGIDTTISSKIRDFEKQGFKVEILATHIDPENTNIITMVLKLS
jgi:hypothetical protein